MLRVAETYGNHYLTESERDIALSIIETILPEAEVRIRRSLSEALKSSPYLDRALARRLAEDVLEVASPILTHSLALTEEDLIEIVERNDVSYARAIALRPAHDLALSDALIRTEDETVVARLAANDNSRISVPGMHRILTRHGDNTSITDAMSARHALPPAVAERLSTLVTGRTLERLIERYALPARRLTAILDHSREHFLLESIAGNSAEALRSFALRLLENKLLSSTLVLRSLAIGQFGFLLQALSIKARLPVANVRRLIADEGARGQGELYDQCGFDRAYRGLFVRLLFEARIYRVSRDGKPPEGWLEVAEPILKKGLQHYDQDWTLEQLVSEVLIEIEDARYTNPPAAGSSPAGGAVARLSA